MTDPEAILRRFSRAEVMHPTDKALSELGRAVKWNSANGFVFLGKVGEIATNRIDVQEVSVLAPHLLQASLVYVNTRMLQTVLIEPKWVRRMTLEDCRGLTPLICSHVNPYRY